MVIHVRPAQPVDADAIDQLILYLDELHATARPDLYCVPSQKPRGDNFLKEALGDPRQHVFVALTNGEPIGYAHIILKHTTAGGPLVERDFRKSTPSQSVQRLNCVGLVANWSKRLWTGLRQTGFTTIKSECMSSINRRDSSTSAWALRLPARRCARRVLSN